MSALEPVRMRDGARLLLIVVIAVLVVGGVAAGSGYRMAHRDGGVAQRNDTLPELCGIVSPETLAKARTTNGDARYSTSNQDGASCVWDQTLGRDGQGMRTLIINIGKPYNADLAFESYLQTQTQASEVTALDGVGDAARSVLTVKKEAKPDVTALQSMSRAVLDEVLGKL